MPWDNENDEENDWADKHLKSRIQFNFDVMKSIERSLALHIRSLLQEARDIQERREYLETDMSDDEELDQTIRMCSTCALFLLLVQLQFSSNLKCYRQN